MTKAFHLLIGLAYVACDLVVLLVVGVVLSLCCDPAELSSEAFDA